MADRSIVVRLRAEVAGFRQAMREAADATRRTNEEAQRANTTMGRMVQSAQRNRAEWDQAGQTLTAFGAIAVAGFAASIKAAISWESSWAGVLKTVDATPSKLAEIEDGLRGLARELPSSHAEIAAVAEAAGQLGVKAEDVVGFTRTMIDLGETTNLSADEAATAIAQISNVMGTLERDGSVGVERFGATLVALGNDGASTEAEILSMAQRIAGAGRLIGATEADVLALSNAMSSMGIRAELGGGVMSRVMTRMYTDVKTGGEGLATLAKVAGVSSAEFAAAFEADPVRAIDSMVQGLGRIKDSGGNVVETMKELGIKGTEETSVILSLTGAGNLLTESLDLGGKAWRDNTALVEEAGKRYDTVEAKISMAKNSIVDAAIGMGNAFLPVIADMAEGVNDFMSMLAGLDPATQAAIGGVAGLTGATLLGAGAFLLLFPRVLETVRAFRTLATVAPRVASALMLVGKATLPILAVAAAIIALDEATKTTIKAPEVADVTSAMLDVSDSAGKAKGSLDEFFAIDSKGGFNPIDGIDGLSEAFDRLSGKGRSMVQWAGDNLNFLPGIDNADVRQVEASFEAIDTALANMQASGAEAQAALNWDVLVADSERAGISVERLKEMFPQYVTALQETENAQRLAGESGQAMTEQQKLAAAVAQEATEAQIKWREALVGSAAEFVSFAGAYDDLVQARTDGAQALADEANKVEGVSKTWQDFYDGQTISIDDYVAKLQEQLDAQAAWQTNMTTIAGQVSQETFDELSKLGPEYAGLIDQLAKEPERLKDIDGMFNTGAENANAFADGIESIYMPELSISATAEPAVAVAADLQNELNNRGLAVPPWAIDANAAPAIGTAGYLQNVLDAKGGAVPDWMIDADTGPAILAADGAVASINDKTASIEVSANTGLATALTEKWMAAFSGKSITVGVRAATGPGGQGGQTFAGGGGVSGPGTGTSDSIPALLSNGEHVFTADDVQKAGGQSGVYRLRQAIQAGNLPAFAMGGAVTAAQNEREDRNRDWHAAVGYSQAILNAYGVSPEYKVAYEMEQAAEKAYRAASDRLDRLAEEERKADQDLRRNEVVSQATSGLSGAYSVVDRLSSMSRNEDLSWAARSSLAATAAQSEAALRGMYETAEGIESALKGARDRASELGSIASGVSSKLLGEFSLTDGLTQKNTNASGDIWYTQTSIAAGAQAKAGAIRSFAGKLASLQKMGLSGAVLQEVASLGSVEGGKVADNLLAAGAGEIGSLNSAFADIAAWSSSAGQYVTEGFYEGGLQAANGLVAGLEAQQGAVEAQILKLAQGMESALRTALGIQSPSKVTTAIGAFTGEGLAVGIRSKRRAIAAAARDMAAAAVPDVAAVSAPVWASPMGYGSSGSSAPVQVNANIDKGAMSAALDGVSLTLMVDGSPVRAIVRTEMSTAAVAVSRGY